MRVFERAAPSVASVALVRSMAGSEVVDGVGSGVVWTTYGHVVTNFHCVSRVDKAMQVREMVWGGSAG